MTLAAAGILFLALPGLAAPTEAPKLIVLPEAQPAPATAPLATPPGIIPAAPSALVVPDGTAAQTAAAQGPLVRLASTEDLRRLTPVGARPASAEASDAASAFFDGSHAPSEAAWDNAWSPQRYFSGGPTAPRLADVDATAQSLFARLLPALYRPLRPAVSYADESEHSWSPEAGHVIRIFPGRPDHEGLVPAAARAGNAPVQQKIWQLATYAHEFAHSLFDAALRYDGRPYAERSAYTILSEGFAVGLTQMLLRRVIEEAPALRLSARDVLDLTAELRARWAWLSGKDNVDAEGYEIWKAAFDAGREEGLLRLLSALDARRLMGIHRADPAFQLALGRPELLASYLGGDDHDARRRGLEAYGRLAGGLPLTEDDRALAARVVEEAGPQGWDRVYRRTLFRAQTVKTDQGLRYVVPDWLSASSSVQPAFVLAQLSPDAGAALAKRLSEAARSQEGLAAIFEGYGHGDRLAAVVSGAELLPWEEAERQAWDQAIGRWLMSSAR